MKKITKKFISVLVTTALTASMSVSLPMSASAADTSKQVYNTSELISNSGLYGDAAMFRSSSSLHSRKWTTSSSAVTLTATANVAVEETEEKAMKIEYAGTSSDYIALQCQPNISEELKDYTYINFEIYIPSIEEGSVANTGNFRLRFCDYVSSKNRFYGYTEYMGDAGYIDDTKTDQWQTVKYPINKIDNSISWDEATTSNVAMRLYFKDIDETNEVAENVNSTFYLRSFNITTELDETIEYAYDKADAVAIIEDGRLNTDLFSGYEIEKDSEGAEKLIIDSESQYNGENAFYYEENWVLPNSRLFTDDMYVNNKGVIKFNAKENVKPFSDIADNAEYSAFIRYKHVGEEGHSPIALSYATAETKTSGEHSVPVYEKVAGFGPYSRATYNWQTVIVPLKDFNSGDLRELNHIALEQLAHNKQPIGNIKIYISDLAIIHNDALYSNNSSELNLRQKYILANRGVTNPAIDASSVMPETVIKYYTNGGMSYGYENNNVKYNGPQLDISSLKLTDENTENLYLNLIYGNSSTGSSSRGRGLITVQVLDSDGTAIGSLICASTPNNTSYWGANSVLVSFDKLKPTTEGKTWADVKYIQIKFNAGNAGYTNVYLDNISIMELYYGDVTIGEEEVIVSDMQAYVENTVTSTMRTNYKYQPDAEYIFGAYEDDDQFMGAKIINFDSQTIKSGETKTVTSTVFELPALSDVAEYGTVKLFRWSDFIQMKPLTETVIDYYFNE